MEQDSWTLSETFKKAGRFRHFLMDVSMLGMAVGAVVATGGAVGLFDALGPFFHMHVAGIPELFTAGGNYLASTFNAESGFQLATENFFTSAHGVHGAAEGAAHAGHVMADASGAVAADPHAGHLMEKPPPPAQPNLSPGAMSILEAG